MINKSTSNASLDAFTASIDDALNDEDFVLNIQPEPTRVNPEEFEETNEVEQADQNNTTAEAAPEESFGTMYLSDEVTIDYNSTYTELEVYNKNGYLIWWGETNSVIKMVTKMTDAKLTQILGSNEAATLLIASLIEHGGSKANGILANKSDPLKNSALAYIDEYPTGHQPKPVQAIAENE